MSRRSYPSKLRNDSTVELIMVEELVKEQMRLRAAHRGFLESKALVDCQAEKVERHKKALACLGIS